MIQNIVFATVTCTTGDPATGLLIRLNEGETWAADDPFVKARPDLFSDEPTRIRRTAHNSPIEAATNNPGEKRKTTRAQR
jgi:hypothetical protein